MSVYIMRQGEIKISNEPDLVIEAHSLGATLAVCLSDQNAVVSGVGIFITPSGTERTVPENLKSASVVTGLPLLFKNFINMGASSSDMKIWLIGCGRFMDSASELDLGLMLYTTAKKIIVKNGFEITGEHVGGPINRSLSLKTGAEHPVVKLVDNTEVKI